MIRALTTVIALSVAFLLAGCGEDKDDISGRYIRTFESGIYSHDQKPCEDPYFLDEETNQCYEHIEVTNELGLRKIDDKSLDFAFTLAFFNWNTCAAKGVAMKDGDGWLYDNGGEGANACKLRIVRQGDAIVLRTDEVANCSAYCGERGNIDGAEFAISSRTASEMSARDIECILPESAENGETC